MRFVWVFYVEELVLLSSSWGGGGELLLMYMAGCLPSIIDVLLYSHSSAVGRYFQRLAVPGIIVRHPVDCERDRRSTG